MARKNNFDNSNKTRVHLCLPTDVYQDIKAKAEEKGISISYFYSQLMCEGFSHYKTQRTIEELRGDVDTLYLALEVISAKIDEMVKLFTIRMPSPQFSSSDEKEKMIAKGSTMARSVCLSAQKAVEDFRLGESNVDSLGIEKLLKTFAEHIESSEKNTKAETAKENKKDEIVLSTTHGTSPGVCSESEHTLVD